MEKKGRKGGRKGGREEGRKEGREGKGEEAKEEEGEEEEDVDAREAEYNRLGNIPPRNRVTQGRATGDVSPAGL